MKALLNEWKKFLKENEHKKFYVRSSILQKYDLGKGDGDDQLYSLLTSGAFTVKELKDIRSDLKDERAENYEILYAATDKKNEVIFDDSYPEYTGEDDPLFQHAKNAGGIMFKSFIFHRKSEILHKNYDRVVGVFNKAIEELKR